MGADGEVPSLSVVIPAFDEAPAISWTVRTMRAALEQLVASSTVRSAEIVVVDDHSRDRTLALLEDLAAEPGPMVVPVSATGPQGLGAAIRRGLAEATGDLILYTDADLPFDPVEIGRMIGTLERYDADILCGYRHDRTVEGSRRAFQSHAYNLLVRRLLPVRVRDVNFACKLLRRPALEAVLGELRSDGPFIDAELVARFAHHDFRIVQLGVDYFPRFGTASTLGGSKAIASIVREATQLHRELRLR